MKMGMLTQEAASFGPLLVSGGFVLALDQVSKRLALGWADWQQRSGRARGVLSQVRVCMNRSAGLVLLPRRYALLLWGVTVLGTLVLIYCATPLQGSVTRTGLGIALGGATSNLLDVIRRGAIVDFIDLRVWPVFNIADVCIILGVGGALWSIH